MTEEECTFEDFMKVDLRIARIEKAEPVEGADKLNPNAANALLKSLEEQGLISAKGKTMVVFGAR